MFRNMNNEGHLSGGQSSSSPAGHGVASAGLDSQESSWIGLFSVVSRPALTFLQRYLPGRARDAAAPERGAGWIRGDLKGRFAEEEREFLRQLDDMMPLTQHAAPHLTYLRCQHGAGAPEPRAGGAVPWLTADSLREIGIQSAAELDMNLCPQTQAGYLSSARTFLSHVLLTSLPPQEVRPAAGRDWATGGKSATWWGSLWGEEGSQKGLLSDVCRAEDGPVTGRLCPQHLGPETKAPAAPAAPGGSTPGEGAGAADHKEQPADNGSPHVVQNPGGSAPDRRLSIGDHLRGSGAAASCSEVALLTPDQDHGYSSLEEEHFQMSHLHPAKAPGGEPPAEPGSQASAPEMEMEGGPAEEEEEAQHPDPQEGPAAEEAEEEEVASAPQCQNKAIAFIMGCPCSDDDSSQSDADSSDDDDGFDSEGSSDLSDSSDEDEDDEASDSEEEEEEEEEQEEEAQAEAERLWSSLCRSLDPYNPSNFTAQLQSGSTAARTAPTPTSSPDPTPLLLSSLEASPSLPSPSPPPSLDVWDDSTSASEADEAESLRLWSSFSSSDPYSPFNFQAPLRTQGPGEAAPRTRTRTSTRTRTGAKKGPQARPRSPRQEAASPPEYRKEEAEERLDSGFSEPSTSTTSTSSCTSSSQSSAPTKKVRFCDNVEEFFASCGEEEEDRRGPWEELARDRCRFLRRCREVEQSIAYCLQPQHRRRVQRRLALHAQDA